MHSLVWHGKKDVRYDETAVPMITDSRDIIIKVFMSSRPIFLIINLVQVTATTICGSDLHLYTGAMVCFHFSVICKIKYLIVSHERR